MTYKYSVYTTHQIKIDEKQLEVNDYKFLMTLFEELEVESEINFILHEDGDGDIELDKEAFFELLEEIKNSIDKGEPMLTFKKNDIDIKEYLDMFYHWYYMSDDNNEYIRLACY